MKLKYKVRQIKTGKWAVWANKNQYFSCAFDNEQDAVKASLLREGHEIFAKLENVQERMESIPGFISTSDPYGWRA